VTAPHQRLNTAATRGGDLAAEHLAALTRAYGRALRAAGRRAARRFAQLEPVTAAANPEWVPPPVGEVIDSAELATDTQRKTSRLHRLMLTSATGAALEPFGLSFDIRSPASQAMLDQVAARIQSGITAAIREQVANAIRDGHENGHSVRQVATAIRTAADEISRPRAEMLARTDLNALSNGGSLLAAQASGAASYKVWTTAEDDRVREMHVDADGQTVTIDAPFDVCGESALYPGDPGLSDDCAINCRCTITYADSLTASARTATPRDFASWRDHAWEGDWTGNAPSVALTSGGTMSDELDDTFAASGDTGLPLSERDRGWDAGEATARVKKWASSDGSGDPDKIDFAKLARAYFWRDAAAGGDAKIGDLKLPFADVVGGKLTAVWRGVTAAAQRLSQTQGVDKTAVQKKISPYYAKAADQYGDTSIRPPWADGAHAVDGEALAAHRAYLADHGLDVLDDDELRAHVLLADRLAATGKHHYAGDGGACAICGQPPSDAAAHYGAATVSLELGDVVLAAAADGATTWQATLCVSGEPTVDNGIKRLLDPDGGSWLPLPLPLALMDDSPHADMVTSAPVCGRIDQIWQAGNVYQASGIFLDAVDDPTTRATGARAAELVRERAITGISVDLCDSEIEMMVYTRAGFDDANDPTAADEMDAPESEAALPNDMPDAAPVEVLYDDDLELMAVFTRWTIAGATIVPVAALAPAATIAVLAAAPHAWLATTEWRLASLTASAAGLAPVEPPADWFDDPAFDGPTPLTVTDDGRVYGHMALWDTCHTGRSGVCVTAPRSPSGYQQFHRGEIRTADGERVEVGTLTMNTNHAGLRASPAATVAHYDDTGAVAAHVRAGEDRFGIWLAGALNPKLSEEDARVLMAAQPSGDWRALARGDGLDLFAVLAVNVPGFPVPRTEARLVASGDELEPVALVAAAAPAHELSRTEFERQLAVLAASADGLEGLAELAAA
jgi:F like protein